DRGGELRGVQAVGKGAAHERAGGGARGRDVRPGGGRRGGRRARHGGGARRVAVRPRVLHGRHGGRPAGDGRGGAPARLGDAGARRQEPGGGGPLGGRRGRSPAYRVGEVLQRRPDVHRSRLRAGARVAGRGVRRRRRGGDRALVRAHRGGAAGEPGRRADRGRGARRAAARAARAGGGGGRAGGDRRPLRRGAPLRGAHGSHRRRARVAAHGGRAVRAHSARGRLPHARRGGGGDAGGRRAARAVRVRPRPGGG